MCKLREKILEVKAKKNMEHLCNMSGLSYSFFDDIIKGSHKKYRKGKLDIAYDHFKLERDEWYHENMKKWVRPTESILGEIFRKKRLGMGLSMDDIDKKLHIGARQIARIEAGDSLPSFGSYTITKLLELYEFTPEEREKIRWFIVVLRDVININNAME